MGVKNLNCGKKVTSQNLPNRCLTEVSHICSRFLAQIWSKETIFPQILFRGFIIIGNPST